MKWLLSIFFLLAACPPPPCMPTDTRCIDNTAEICSPDYEWLMFMDCTDAGLTCRTIPEGHTCLPVLNP